ncbi:MAG: conjugal transfer protein TraX [Lachnospiraceae bacterium]|nr:conjugal transfer protein TraX [Lachnospiraceae bacterium]
MNNKNPNKKQQFCNSWRINGGDLKLIAMITMLIDHFGAAFLIFYMNIGDNRLKYHELYNISRSIGRISFPIFIFLLVEGLYHTRNIGKYLLRLSLFCIISEIPFDLAFRRQVFDWQYQNVFFTLLIGLAAIALIQYKNKFLKTASFLDCLANIIIAAAAMLLADFLKTDYSWVGILAILTAYWLHSSDLQMWFVCLVLFFFSSNLELYALFCIPFIQHYNGKKGHLPKWMPYLFYPVHLLILWGITSVIYK